MKEQVKYFRKEPKPGKYIYYEVHGDAEYKRSGWQQCINWLNDRPIIYVEHNYEADPSGVTGTWTTYQEAEEITKDEYTTNYKEAIASDFITR